MKWTIALSTLALLGFSGAPMSSGAPADAPSRWIYSAGLVPQTEFPSLFSARSVSAVQAEATGQEPINTDWRTLLGLNYMTGQTTPELESRRGKVVRIPGFMVPFDDGMAGVNEFLLVPYFGACIHTPPPPPNQIVYVRMQGGRQVEVNIWDAIFIEGVLDIESIESPYGTVGHQVLGQRIRPYTLER
jgi:uncharacterized protein